MPSANGRRGGQSAVWAAYRNVRDGSSASRGRISKSVSSRKPRTTGRKPYTPPTIDASQRVYYGKVEVWDDSRLVPGTKKIMFGENFDIDGTHLDAIISKGPSLCLSLQYFESGNDDTGKGYKLNDAAVIRLASAAPNLVHVSLSGSTGLTDASLLALLNHCPQVRYIAITGNDRVTGKIKGPALNTLRERPELGKTLDTLCLTDQSYECNTAVKKLSAARKKLAIEVGCTGEGGGGVSTWLGGKEKDGYEAIDGPGGLPRYGGY